MKNIPYSNARTVAKLRLLSKHSIHPQDWDDEKQDIPRHTVYNNLTAIPLESAKLTMETRRQSDELFTRLLPLIGPRKLPEKRAFFQQLFHAGKRATHSNGCVRYSRDNSGVKRIHLGVINAAVTAGLFLDHKSPPGSEKMSRLLPLSPIEQYFSCDPWDFDPNRQKQLVYLTMRETDNEKTASEIPFDPSIGIAAETQEKLELINEVNSKFTITYSPLDEWTDSFTGERQLRPIHYAIFKQGWDLYGRLHTGKYGHQSLRKVERSTIRFNGEFSLEPDYGGMHPRALYHLEGIPFEEDPYALWGDWRNKGKLAGPLRLVAKQLINAAINAKDSDATVNACNRAMHTRTKTGERKTGLALMRAQRLYRAVQATGINFKELYPVAEKHHRQIKHYFGTDYGVKLMRFDSMIALDILHHFAKRGCPCLSVHDSFIVPKSQVNELRRVMFKFYEAQFGFPPVVKMPEFSPLFLDNA
jgi:hypothetical protein